MEFSKAKWDKEYANWDWKEYVQDYSRDYLGPTLKQIGQHYKIKFGDTFLEIGCGISPLCFFMEQFGMQSYGVDFSELAINMAKALYSNSRILYKIADITDMPLSNDMFNFVYGAGVLEHIPNTQKAINEIYRVLKCGGISINTVPFCNLSTLYRQQWGDIPNLPILRPLTEFIHIKLFRAKHMKFGYSLAFTAGQMKRMHEWAGFKNIRIAKWDTVLQFKSMPRFMRGIFTYIANNSRFFWPMIVVVAEK